MHSTSAAVASTARGASIAQPKPPSAAVSAFTYYCADHRRDVDALPFNQRAAALGEMWRQHADRATYDRKALADRARFVRETAEYDAAMDEYEEAVEAAKKAAEAAEFAAAEAEDAAREQRREAEAERKALAAKRPKAVRTLSAVEQRMRDHNAAMKAAAEDPQRAAARTAFILSHAEVLRPFVSPGILDKEAAKPRKAKGKGRIWPRLVLRH